MSTRRSDTHSEFSTLHNEILQNSGLSMEALGLLVYLLSLPRGWEIRMAEIDAQFSVGKDKRRRVVKELFDAGYLTADEIRSDAGQFDGVQYTISKNAGGKK